MLMQADDPQEITCLRPAVDVTLVEASTEAGEQQGGAHVDHHTECHPWRRPRVRPSLRLTSAARHHSRAFRELTAATPLTRSRRAHPAGLWIRMQPSPTRALPHPRLRRTAAPRFTTTPHHRTRKDRHERLQPPTRIPPPRQRSSGTTAPRRRPLTPVSRGEAIAGPPTRAVEGPTRTESYGCGHVDRATA